MRCAARPIKVRKNDTARSVKVGKIGQTDGRTDGRTPDRYITLFARRGQRRNNRYEGQYSSRRENYTATQANNYTKQTQRLLFVVNGWRWRPHSPELSPVFHPRPEHQCRFRRLLETYLFARY